MEIEIKTKWNGDPIDHSPVRMSLTETKEGIHLKITAPYFNDPAPNAEAGKPMWCLWEYEVAELFFLNSKTGEYLEVEYGPHGQHLGLLLKKRREVWKKDLEFNYTAKICENIWEGDVIVPWDYLPSGVDKFNAYAIHGTEPNRVYEAYNPVPKDEFTEPDYHRLEYFKGISLAEIFPNGKWEKASDTIWKD